jgi:hypothetical protein
MKKTDKEAYAEYIKKIFVRSNMQIIASNSLAFPNAKVHARIIMSLVRQKKIVELESFLKENDCFANSITESDALFSIASSAVTPDLSSSE